MKKIVSFALAAVVTASLFAASFKTGATIYVSKESNLTESEKSSKAITTLPVGTVVTVIESNSKKTKVSIDSIGEGWVDNKNLTKKKVIANSTVKTNIDNLALAGKGSVKADAKKDKTEEKKVEETVEVKAAETAETVENAAETTSSETKAE